MIASKLLRHGLLSAAMCAGPACAAGLGEITLHSRIGEPLRAEVAISAQGEPLDASCFSLGPVPGADFPVITAGRTRLVRINQDYRLIITGSKTIDEPVILISLRAACGIDLQREYVLLPAPPLAPAEAAGGIESPAAPAAPTARLAPPTGEIRSTDIDAPSRPAARPRSPRTPKNTTPKANAPLPRDTLAGLSGQDRIVLGAAPDDLPLPGTSDPLPAASALEERVLKMETTLHLLNEEVDKLGSALALNAESRSLQQKLQQMQAQQTTPALAPSLSGTPPEAPARAEASHDGWLELLLGLILGGSVSAGVAHFVSRRHEKHGSQARQDKIRPPKAALRLVKPARPRR